MEIKCKTLLYFEKRRFLMDMKNACEAFLEQLDEKTLRKFPPLRYLIEIDVMDLLDVFPDVGDFLLKEPQCWIRVCNEIIFACLKSVNNECSQYIKSGQVGIILRLKCLPRLLSPLTVSKYKGVTSFHGILISVAKSISYVYHTVWSCPEECEGNEVILQYIPQFPPKCYVCRSVLFENSGMRRCGEQVVTIFKLKNNLLSKKFIVVDDLIAKLRLGARYTIYATVTKKITLVFSLEETNILPAPDTTPIPKDIKDLYAACDGVPYKFIYCLASSIGVHVSPLNCFMHVKINLLLSLASVKAHGLHRSAIVHILAAGFDTGFIGKLMLEAAKLADRHVYLGSNSCVSTTLIAASGGVCFMPLPIHVYNQKLVQGTLSALESNEVCTETSKMKLQCAVWAHGMDLKKNLLLNASSVFGNVCRADFGEHCDDIAEFLLDKSVQPLETSNEEIQALNDVLIYLDQVAGINVIVERAAENVLKSYFMAARRERPNAVTVGSMGTLVAVCMTSARLCRRSVANVDDAVFAIWLHVRGGADPRFAPEEYLETPGDVKKLQEILDHFKDWLKQFTGCFLS